MLMSGIREISARHFLCLADDGAGDGGAGGGSAVSDAFGGGDAGAAAAAAGGGDGGGGDAAASAAAAAAAAADPPPAWLENFSADAVGEEPSHREWLAKKGVKTLDDLAKSYRELERWRGQNGNRIEVPKADATPEQVAAFRTAIGVPATAADYKIALPEGVSEAQLNGPFVDSFREAALAAGIPAGSAEALGKWYLEQQLDLDAAAVTARNQETDAKFKEWGGAKDSNLALCNRAASQLGLDRQAVADIQKGLGAGRTLDLMLKLGNGLAEDAFVHDGGKGKFGITPAEAKAEKDRMFADAEQAKKIREKDPVATARLDRLNQVIANDMDQQQGRRAG